MKERPWLKWICIVLTLASLAALFHVAYQIKESNQAERDKLRERAEAYNETMKPLLSEKRRIERELTALDNEQIKANTFAASVLFLCTEPDARLMEDVVPMLDDYGYSGLLTVSGTQFFGDAGCLTLAQVNELLRNGWEICISADAETDIGALYSRLAEAELPAPVAVYYPEGDFCEEHKSTLQELGIDKIICYGRKAESGLWCVTAYGSYENDSKDRFLGMTQAGDSVALTVGYSRTREKFSSSNLSAMLRTVDAGTGDGTAYVRSLTAAYECYYEYISSSSKTFENRRSELQERLDEIDAKLWENAK